MHDPQASIRVSRTAGELSECAGCLHSTLWCCGARVRLEILAHLACCPMSLGEIALAVQLDNPLVSKYLKALRIGRVVVMRKDKKRHIFSLAPSVVIELRDAAVELRFPVEGNLFVAVSLPHELLQRLHPDIPIRPTLTPVIAVGIEVPQRRIRKTL